MTLLRAFSVSLLLVQIFTSRANPTAFVLGNPEFLDSGQPRKDVARTEDAPMPLYSSIYNSVIDYGEQGDYENYFDSSEEDDYNELIPDYEHLAQEIIEEYLNALDAYYDSEIEEEDYDDDDEDWFVGDYLDSSEEEDINASLERSRRVKRRILPIGKALDRGSSSGSDRNPYGRGRSSSAAPMKGQSVTVRNGPVGSDALYTQFPLLAPPQWREAHGYGENGRKIKRIVKPKKKPKRKQQRDVLVNVEEVDTQVTPKKKIVVNLKSQKRIREILERRAQKAIDAAKLAKPVAKSSEAKAYSKRKNRLSKDMKDQVAAYAAEHGVTQAVEHFTKKFRTQLLEVVVDKYMKRYKRMRARREESRTK